MSDAPRPLYDPPVTRDVALRAATAGDLAAARALLDGARLPLDGLEEQWGEGYAVLATVTGEVLGTAGVETHGEHGLLRSVAVHPDWQGAGLGRLLVEDRLRWARERGLRDVWLLTTTAADWFPSLGFAPALREAAPDAIRRSTEWASACPASAVALHRPLV